MRALLLIDIQNDYFPTGAFTLPNMDFAAGNAAKLLAWARREKIKIIHVRHEENDPSGEFLVKGTKGAEINERVLPRADEIVIAKNFPNSFRETELAESLDGTQELIIAGAMSNMCIDATSRAAFDLGFKVIVVEDACAASELEFHGKKLSAEDVHGAFMAALASAYGEVTTTESVCRFRN